jgi:hypothetical protein
MIPLGLGWQIAMHLAQQFELPARRNRSRVVDRAGRNPQQRAISSLIRRQHRSKIDGSRWLPVGDLAGRTSPSALSRSTTKAMFGGLDPDS